MRPGAVLTPSVLVCYAGAVSPEQQLLTMADQPAQHSYQYYRNALHGCPMPFAFVDLDLLQANIRQTVRRVGAKRIRLASKSIRARALVEKILAANPAFQGIMCFSAPEAVWLSQRGLDDLLLGYPCWHAEQIGAICDEVRQGKTIVLMVDSAEHMPSTLRRSRRLKA
jgi:D-serine deaminase-like pyridoxal phosphate-dependent protein